MRVVGWLRDVAIYATEFRNLAGGLLTRGGGTVGSAVVLWLKCQSMQLQRAYIAKCSWLTPMLGPDCAGVSPGKGLCSAASVPTGFS